MASPSSVVGPVLLLLVVLASDAWVFRDAASRAEQGRPVVAVLGPWELATPPAWMLACLLLWVVFFPLYLRARAET